MTLVLREPQDPEGNRGAKTQSEQKLTDDSRRFTQIRIRTFHRRDAEFAEEIPFAQSGDDDWAKAYSSNLSNVFVCRRLPTNKKLVLCALCGNILKGLFFCVHLRWKPFAGLASWPSGPGSAPEGLRAGG